MRCRNIFKAKEGSKDNSFCVACPDFLCSFFSGRCHLLGFTVASEIQWNKSLREIMAWKMSSKTQIQLTTRVNREAKTPTVFRWSENVLLKCINGLSLNIPLRKIVSGQRRGFSKFRPNSWNLVTRNKFWERGRGPALCLIPAHLHQSFREQFSVKLSETKNLVAGVTKNKTWFPCHLSPTSYLFDQAYVCLFSFDQYNLQELSMILPSPCCLVFSLMPQCPGLYKAVCHPVSPVTRRCQPGH